MKPPEHPYQSCRDADCERPYCQIWKQAFAEGYEYGFADGLDSCPCGRSQ